MGYFCKVEPASTLGGTYPDQRDQGASFTPINLTKVPKTRPEELRKGYAAALLRGNLSWLMLMCSPVWPLKVMNSPCMDRRDEDTCAEPKHTIHAITDELQSLNVKLNATNIRISKLEVTVNAVYVLLQRLERSQLSQSPAQMDISYQEPEPPTKATTSSKKAPLSPKTMMIEMMEEEREEQQRALEQIDDLYEETRPWQAPSLDHKGLVH